MLNDIKAVRCKPLPMYIKLNIYNMTIDEAIKIIFDGEAILFVGSGFSRGATNSNEAPFQTAESLAKRLSAMCGNDENDLVDDLCIASEIFQEERGEHELVEYLLKEFTAIKVSDEQKLISSLPWHRIYTTNYDNVVELACISNNKTLSSPVLSDNPKDYINKGRLCVHINGKVDRLTIDKLNGEFKLTNRSYLTEDFLNSSWLTIFRTDLRTAKAVFFIGYSMKYDLDLQRTVYASDAHDKIFFISYPDDKKPNLKYLEKYGTPYPIGTDGFAKKINEIKKSNYHPITKLDYQYLCFEHIKTPKTPKIISDKDVFNFLYDGSLQIDKLYYSLLSSDYMYSIHRTKLDEAMEAIESGEKKLLIHSDLGNGKTVFVRSLEHLLCEKGYSVYHYRKYWGTAEREIEQICRSHERTVIVFEDYVGSVDLLKSLACFYTDQVLIMSERTATNEANYYTISELFEDFYHIDVNLLDAKEITSFVELLDYYGMWHDLAAKQIYMKEDFIRFDCKQRISNVILKLLDSSDIQNRFKVIIEKIKTKNVYYEAVLFILIAHISKLSIDIDDLSNALGTSKLNTPSFKKDPAILEFIDFENSEIKNKSAIVSEYILGRVLESSVVVEVIIKTFRRLATQRQDNATRRILTKMMTFSNLQHILNRQDPDYTSSLLFLYERLGKMDYCRTNPHYWLQYAIVMLSQYNYPRADAYFKNAYAYAKNNPRFDTFQIDNHHARFILENEQQYGSNDTCMEAFDRAHAILMDPKHKQVAMHYPYKVAQNYYPFYEKFFKKMKDGEKKRFINACNEMISRIKWYEDFTKEVHRDVKKARERLELILRESDN
jgi:hypothetical protein